MSTALDLIKTVGPSIVGGVLSRRASGRASRRLVSGTNSAADLIRSSASGVRDRLRPYQDVGLENLHTLNDRVNAPTEKFSYTGADLLNDPGYQFGLTEGQRAIKAAGNAGGTRFSGATLKTLDRYATDYASTKFNDAFNRNLTTFRTNREGDQDQLDRIRDLAGIGERANAQDVDVERITAQQLADLEQAKAEAEASGDLGKANAISQAIEQGVSSVQALDLIKALGKKAAPAAASGAALLGPATLSVPGVGAVTAGVPSLAGVGSGAASLSGLTTGASLGAIPAPAAAPGVATAAPAGTTGFSGAVTGFLTNPITIGVGAALAAGLIWRKSQAHHEANQFVQGFQNPFVNAQRTGILNKVVDGFNQAADSGQLTREQALQIRAQVLDLVNHFEQQRQQFGAKGSDQRKVAEQAKSTMTQYYGPNFSGLLGSMDQKIARLAA